MRIGTVIGTVTAPVRNPRLSSYPLLIVQFGEEKKLTTSNVEPIVASDTVGAGIGQTVLVAMGSAARVPEELQGTIADAAIVAIVDEISFK